MQQRRAESTAAGVGMDAAFRAATLIHLGVRDQALAIEHGDTLGGDVEARSLPVAEYVVGVEESLADVMLLAGRDEIKDHVDVVHGCRTVRQPSAITYGGELYGSAHVAKDGPFHLATHSNLAVSTSEESK